MLWMEDGRCRSKSGDGEICIVLIEDGVGVG